MPNFYLGCDVSKSFARQDPGLRDQEVYMATVVKNATTTVSNLIKKSTGVNKRENGNWVIIRILSIEGYGCSSFNIEIDLTNYTIKMIRYRNPITVGLQ